jgi:hypothetical protein
LCPGPSHNGDCQSCLTLRVECLHRYYQPVPVEYRVRILHETQPLLTPNFAQTRDVINQLTKWHRGRGTRQGDEMLSLTDFVRSRSSSGYHLAPPTFSARPFHPDSHIFDQKHALLPPLTSPSHTASGSYSEGSPPHDEISDPGDDPHALEHGDGSPWPPHASQFSPILNDPGSMPSGTDEPLWATPITSPFGAVPDDQSNFGGFGGPIYDLGVRNTLSEPGVVHASACAPNWLLTTEPETITPVFNLRECPVVCASISENTSCVCGLDASTLDVPLETNAATRFHQLHSYDGSPSMQRTVYSGPPFGPTAAHADTSSLMRNHQRRTESAIPPTWTTRYGQGTQDPQAAYNEASHSGTGPLLSQLHYSVAHSSHGNYQPSDIPEYDSQ